MSYSITSININYIEFYIDIFLLLSGDNLIENNQITKTIEAYTSDIEDNNDDNFDRFIYSLLK